jgi:rhamnosyltransferase
MKILQVVHHFFPNTIKAGTEIVTYNLSKQFQENGHQTAVFYSEFGGARKNFSVQGNFFENLQTFRVYNDQSQSMFGLVAYNNKKIDRHFSAYLDRWSPDIVHFHHLIDLSFGMIDECKKRNIPVFLTLHDFWLMCPQIQRYNSSREEVCHEINHQDCVNCINHKLVDLRRQRFKRIVGKLLRKKNIILNDKDVHFFALNSKGAKQLGPANYISVDGTENKNYIYMHPDSKMIFKGIKFEKSDKIKFKLAISSDVVKRISGIVRFKILLDQEIIFDKQLDTKKLHECPDFEIYITGKGTKDVCLETIGIKDIAYCGTMWENIRIEKNREEQTLPMESFIEKCFMLLGKKAINVKWLTKRKLDIKSKLPQFEKIFAPTPFLYEEFKKWGTPNLVLSEDAIETKLFENFSKSRDLQKEIRFAFIGAPVPIKGLHVLIKAFNNIKAKNVFLDIYGDLNCVPEYGKKLVNMVKNENIKFVGTFEINQVAEVFKKFDVLVMPSLWFENAPLVLRNTILAKTPVIATDVGGMNYLIQDGKNGLTFPLGDEKHLQEQLEKIIQNPRLIETFSKHMPTIKNVKQSAKELEEYYLEALKRRNQLPQIRTCPGVEPYKFKVSIVIPTYNGAKFIEEVITMIKKQTGDFSYEIVFVDCGSTDETLEIIKKNKYTVFSIDKKDFNHGLTRNFGVSKTSGEIIVVLTQDAIPADENWLRNILKYYDDEDVAGVYVRQVPRDDCDYLTKKRINESFIGRDKVVVNQIDSYIEYANLSPFQKYAVTNFDDVCGSFRRKFWKKNPYQKMVFGEDIRFGIDIILSGKKIVYTHEAPVIHSHNRGVIYDYKRHYLSHLLFLDFFDLTMVPNSKVWFTATLSLIKKDLKYIWNLPLSFWEKISQTSFLVILNIVNNAAGYKAFRDFKIGKTKSYKI